MFKVTVLYNHPVDPEAFEKYYAEIHTPLAMKIPGLKNFDVTKFVETPQGKPSFYRMAELSFASAEEMQAGFDSPEGQATAADLANFATGGLSMLVGVIEKIC
jgi:uncharacterized protein (TIGR02118 family)